MEKKALLTMTADIVASHASMNALTNDELVANIGRVYAKLASLAGADIQGDELAVDISDTTTTSAPKPAVPLEAAFAPDKVFCMICGKSFKTLKRHLTTTHDMKAGQYRKQFGIPTGTPLVAADYVAKRKTIAAGMDLNSRLAKARAARKYNRGNVAEVAAPVAEVAASKTPKVVKRKAKTKNG